MPTYVFQCTACQVGFEKFLSMSKRHLPTMEACPSCGQLKVESRIGASQVCADSTRILNRPLPTGFQEVLAKIHENTPGSNLGDKLSRTPNRYKAL
jgi:putative FmdB family regulatory protein